MDERLDELPLDAGKGELIARSVDTYGAMVDLLLERGGEIGLTPAEAVGRAFELHEAARSRAFVAQLAHAPFAPPDTVPAELRERERDLLAVNRELQEDTGQASSASHRLWRLREVERDLRRCWEEMRAVAPGYVRLRTGEPVTVEEVRRLIEGDDARVAVVSFLCQKEHTTCFVLRSDEPGMRTHRLDVGRDELQRAATALRRAFNGAPDEFPPIRRSGATGPATATSPSSTTWASGCSPSSRR